MVAVGSLVTVVGAAVVVMVPLTFVVPGWGVVPAFPEEEYEVVPGTAGAWVASGLGVIVAAGSGAGEEAGFGLLGDVGVLAGLGLLLWRGPGPLSGGVAVPSGHS